ncbi:MAG: hypothetical protein H0U66_06255 [Gemmatimonadaceae bacterium]|nr:hypothetical protein [Gemmatimonadaceae bacterium]
MTQPAIAIVERVERADPAQPRASGSAALRYLRGNDPVEEYKRLVEKQADLVTQLRKVTSEKAEIEMLILTAGGTLT